VQRAMLAAQRAQLAQQRAHFAAAAATAKAITFERVPAGQPSPPTAGPAQPGAPCEGQGLRSGFITAGCGREGADKVTLADMRDTSSRIAPGG